jgi:hypothetical protein
VVSLLDQRLSILSRVTSVIVVLPKYRKFQIEGCQPFPH